MGEFLLLLEADVDGELRKPGDAAGNEDAECVCVCVS